MVWRHSAGRGSNDAVGHCNGAALTAFQVGACGPPPPSPQGTRGAECSAISRCVQHGATLTLAFTATAVRLSRVAIGVLGAYNGNAVLLAVG